MYNRSTTPLLVFICVFIVAFLTAMAMKFKGLSVQDLFIKKQQETVVETTYSKKLNFDPGGKFVYTVSVPDNYIRKTNKELDGINYPKELLSLTDSDLLAVKCGATYRSGEKGLEAFVLGVIKYAENDTELSKIIKQKEQVAGPKLNYLQVCDVENGLKITSYGVTLNTGKNIHFFGLNENGKNNDLQLEGSATVCDLALAVKTDKTMYYKCAMNEDKIGLSEIYFVDFGLSKIRKLISCENVGQDIRCAN